MPRTATITQQPPATGVQKGKAIKPAIEVKVEFDRSDEWANKIFNVFATAYLYGEGGREMTASDVTGGVGEKYEPASDAEADPHRVCLHFTFPGFEVKRTGNFYVKVVICGWHEDPRQTEVLISVKSENFIVAG